MIQASKLKVLIVDDEPLARSLLRNLLKEFDGFTVIGECGNGHDALEMTRSLVPDIVFLDVQMPEMDGFAVLEKMIGEKLPLIIFVTAHDQYAVRAFDFHAVDYLLKPYSRQRFEETLTRAKEQHSLRASMNYDRNLSALLENYEIKGGGKVRRLFLKDKGKITLLEPDTIDWIGADDKYVRIYAGGQKFLERQTLTSLETQLDPTIFVRIHRSTLVNITRVKELSPLFSGEYVLVLTCGRKLTLSRTFKNKFFERFARRG